MKDYSEFPPIRYFERVLKTAPRSALLYIQIWQEKNNQMKAIIPKQNIRKGFVITPTRFRNLLEPLMFLNLIIFEDLDESFLIEFMGPNLSE
jgi:hypothetical protein